MNATPSPFKIQSAFTSLAEARERLLTIDPTIAEDQPAFVDNLEGISDGDPLAVVDALIEGAIEAEHMAEAVRMRRTELAERLARHVKHAEWLRDTARDFLTGLGISKLQRATYTASVGPGRPHVLPLLPPEELPPRFQRVSVDVNKTALAEALKAGEEDTPATWSNPQPVLTIRVR